MRPRRVTLFASLGLPQDGAPPPGTWVWVTAEVGVEPLLRGVSVGGNDQPYPPPPLLDLNGNPFPAPTTLFSTGAGDILPFPSGLANGATSLTRRTCVATDGTVTLTVPAPSALAWSAGARTDADLDPLRWGRWDVRYFWMMQGGDPILFRVDESLIDLSGILDVTPALNVASAWTAISTSPAPLPGGVPITDPGTAPPAPTLLALLAAQSAAQSAALAALSAQITALAARPSILDEGTLP